MNTILTTLRLALLVVLPFNTMATPQQDLADFQDYY